MATLIWFLYILEVAVGLGFVIFIHELGHFLLAKWNGVKVEKFSIGFGRTLVGFRRGETEYVLAAIPLGGFVKMLGEEPEDEANQSTDPRAYPNKSVWARMAIISAGVIMNVLLGLACFVYAYGRGMDEVPPVVGGVFPGGPAYEAGIRPGDVIVAVDGRRDISFNSMTLKVMLSGAGQIVHFDVERPGREGRLGIDVEPRRESSSPVPKIGVAASMSLRLAGAPLKPFEAPAGMAGATAVKSAVKPDDLLVALGPKDSPPVPVKDEHEFRTLLARYRDVPLVMVFERALKKGASAGKATERVEVTVPPTHVVDFGFRLTIEPISVIRANSPAEKGGFRVGDRIVRVDGRDDFNPMQLPDLCMAGAGRPMTFDVERPEPGHPPAVKTLTVTPDANPASIQLVPDVPLEVPGLGLAFPVRPKITAVVPGSPADKAGLRPGQEIIKLALPPLVAGKKTQSREVKLGEAGRDWPYRFEELQIGPSEPVTLTLKNSTQPVKLTPEPVADWFYPRRGFYFEPLVRRLPPQPVGSALRRGADDTIENILRIYMMLRSLVQARVSPKLLGGPIMIAQVAYSQAESGLTELVHFLGILSINLAVLNFLPIPPLDGGQMVFLIAEKVRGRPLPVGAVTSGSYIGIAMLLFLMAYVMLQDVLRLLF